jgi:hypothetical protein
MIICRSEGELRPCFCYAPLLLVSGRSSSFPTASFSRLSPTHIYVIVRCLSTVPYRVPLGCERHRDGLDPDDYDISYLSLALPVASPANYGASITLSWTRFAPFPCLITRRFNQHFKVQLLYVTFLPLFLIPCTYIRLTSAPVSPLDSPVL